MQFYAIKAHTQARVCHSGRAFQQEKSYRRNTMADDSFDLSGIRWSQDIFAGSNPDSPIHNASFTDDWTGVDLEQFDSQEFNALGKF